MTDFSKLVLEEIPDGVVVTTPEGVVLYWNSGAETLFGYAQTEALQRTLDELIGPDERSTCEAAPTPRVGTLVREVLHRKKMAP